MFMQLSPTAMRRWVAAALCFSLAIPAIVEAETRAEYRAKLERARYIASTRPKRNEAYLRQENITDEEVKELQGAARSVLPEAIVNIGGVTSDCPCEDGHDCSAQVWVVAYDPKKTVGLMFSKIDGHWGIGPVQNWWLRHDELQRMRPRKSDKLLAWFEEQEALDAAFPSCGAQQAVPGSTPPLRGGAP
jgi:hypothetical protein